MDTERTVEVQTLSKTYSMAGWRFGYAAGNASVIDGMKRYQAHAFRTMFGATQAAAAVALAGDQSAASELVDVYQRRRDLVVAGLRALGGDVFGARRRRCRRVRRTAARRGTCGRRTR